MKSSLKLFSSTSAPSRLFRGFLNFLLLIINILPRLPPRPRLMGYAVCIQIMSSSYDTRAESSHEPSQPHGTKRNSVNQFSKNLFNNNGTVMRTKFFAPDWSVCLLSILSFITHGYIWHDCARVMLAGSHGQGQSTRNNTHSLYRVPTCWALRISIKIPFKAQILTLSDRKLWTLPNSKHNEHSNSK